MFNQSPSEELGRWLSGLECWLFKQEDPRSDPKHSQEKPDAAKCMAVNPALNGDRDRLGLVGSQPNSRFSENQVGSCRPKHWHPQVLPHMCVQTTQSTFASTIEPLSVTERVLGIKEVINCMCIYCVCVSVHAHMCVHYHVLHACGGPQTTSRVILGYSGHHPPPETGSLRDLEPTFQAICLASESQKSICLWLPRTGITSAYDHTLHGCQGLNLGPSAFKASSLPTEPSSKLSCTLFLRLTLLLRQNGIDTTVHIG